MSIRMNKACLLSICMMRYQVAYLTYLVAAPLGHYDRTCAAALQRVWQMFDAPEIGGVS